MNEADVYQILAQKMVSDSNFVTELQKDPRSAIDSALRSEGVVLSPRELNGLVIMYENFIGTEGAESLDSAATSYLGDRTETDAV